MTLTRTVLLTLGLSLLLMVAGALVVSFTTLGILGWAFILVGILGEAVAVTRQRRPRSEGTRSQAASS